MVTTTIKKFGRIDVVVYNSGAIWWSSVEKTPMKRFQLMQRVNPEGLYGTVQAVLPEMYKNGAKGKGRIVVISPPIYSRFFKGKTAYAMGKVGMSVLTMGLAVDFEREGREEMAISSLWPAVVSSVVVIEMISILTLWTQAIESAATQRETSSSDLRKDLRSPEIFSDAILSIIRAPAKDVSGKTFLDEDYLRDHDGVRDFSKYALVPGTSPRRIMPLQLPDLTVAEQADEGVRMDSSKL